MALGFAVKQERAHGLPAGLGHAPHLCVELGLQLPFLRARQLVLSPDCLDGPVRFGLERVGGALNARIERDGRRM